MSNSQKPLLLSITPQDLMIKQDSVTSKNKDKGVASLFDEQDNNPENQGNPTNPVSDNNQSNQENQTNHSSDNLDIGFRVFRLADSNMQDVYYRPQEFSQETLDLFADNVKPGRTPLDLLTQVMLDWGLPLSLKIETLDILGKQVFSVAQNSLYACFDKGIDEAFAKAIATYKPMRIVFRDSGFANDSAKINVQQLLKQLSPETEMKVV